MVRDYIYNLSIFLKPHTGEDVVFILNNWAEIFHISAFRIY